MTTDQMCEAAVKGKLWEVNLKNGAVFSHQANKYVGGLNGKGYRVATLNIGKERKQVKLHRVVWIAANGIPPFGYVLDHINGKKDDNRLSNLRLADATLNSTNRRSYKGKDNPAAKLHDAIVESIRLEYAQNETSYKKLAKKFRVSPTLIAKIVRNEIWN